MKTGVPRIQVVVPRIRVLYRGYGFSYRGYGFLYRGYGFLYLGFSFLYRRYGFLYRGFRFLYRGYGFLYRGCRACNMARSGHLSLLAPLFTSHLTPGFVSRTVWIYPSKIVVCENDLRFRGSTPEPGKQFGMSRLKRNPSGVPL